MNKTTKNIITKISILIGLIIFITISIISKTKRDNEIIKNISIHINEYDGNFFITKNQILAHIDKKFEWKNTTISSDDLEKLEKYIIQIPQIKTADAYIDNNKNLAVKIIQREPFLRVFNKDNETYYIDKEGMKFPITNTYTAKVPIITGNITEGYNKLEKIKSKNLNEIFKVYTEIAKDKYWSVMFGQIYFNQKSQIELIPKICDATIIFGDSENINEKLQRLDIFNQEVLRNIGWNTYKVINIMYKDEVVCLK